MGFSPSTNWKRGLRRASLVGLAALIVAGGPDLSRSDEPGKGLAAGDP